MPPPEQRHASDHNRVAVIRLLEQARLESRISAAQQHDRVNHALAATTLGELDALLRDLGGATPSIVGNHQERRRQQWLVAMVCTIVAVVALLGALLLFR